MAKHNSIGPRMLEAAKYVALNPGCSKIDVARHLRPDTEYRSAYSTVDRLIYAGIVHAKYAHGKYSLYTDPQWATAVVARRNG
jgi:hypothetical protein